MIFRKSAARSQKQIKQLCLTFIKLFSCSLEDFHYFSAAERDELKGGEETRWTQYHMYIIHQQLDS